MRENSLYDKKSLRAIHGSKANFKEIAKNCVGFANAQGGMIDNGHILSIGYGKTLRYELSRQIESNKAWFISPWHTILDSSMITNI